MNARPAHLPEERLLDCYLAERDEEPIDPRVAEHLADCDACAVRYADLARFMDGLREDADAEAEEVFTPDQLAAQQRQIARRLEHVGRAARVITFPERAAGRHADVVARRLTPRWVTAAVAAGLFLGVALGATFQWERRAPAPQQTAASTPATRPARLAPVATAGAGIAAAADDDAFLTDLEVALERPQTRVLQPFDAITPHVREIANIR